MSQYLLAWYNAFCLLQKLLQGTEFCKVFSLRLQLGAW